MTIRINRLSCENRFWAVIGKLLPIVKIGAPKERVSDAYEHLISTLSPDTVPASIKGRFETLCREFQERNNNPHFHYVLAAKMFMHSKDVRYFTKSMFELCRDGIRSE
jgi:hypothetical protein